MSFNLPKGIFPVMLTAFNEDGSLDFDGINQLTDFYLRADAAGLFACALSAEVNFLDDSEKIKLAEHIVRYVNGRVPVVAGALSDGSLENTKKLIREISETGADVVTIAASQIAKENDDDETWIHNMDFLLRKIPENIKLGLYETPWPYHRLLTEKLFRWVIQTGRFYFLKDTCGQITMIKNKLLIGQNSTLKLFNANTQTLLLSLHAGAHGFSGIGANYFPKLYAWLCDNFNNSIEKSNELQNFLTESCEITEGKFYPVNAKELLRGQGLKITSFCRAKQIKLPESEFDKLMRLNIKAKELQQKLNIKL